MTGVGNITMGTEASKATLTFPYSATRTYTIPLVDTAAHFLMSKGDQAIDGTKTFNSTIVGSITGNAAFADGSTNAVNCSRQVIAGNGLTGGGFLNADRTVTMGTPGGCSNLTSNAVTSESHTHAITGFSLSTHNHAGVYATESHLHDASNITTGILAQARGGTGINTVTPTEYGYLSGVTSGIQTQLNGKLASALKGAANGLAELDASGHVPAAQLPSYVDDVLEYANFASFPGTGETGKIYLALDTNIIYRWSGSAYAEISSSLALGETSSTAYRGDRGAAAYAAAVTNATNANTANTLVKRDASGNFSAGTITAALSGNATTATTAAAAPWSGITDKPSSFAPSSHAVNASTYGYGDATNAGHLRVGSGLAVLSGTVSHSTGAGYNHIPSGGSSGQILGYASAGAAAWVSPPATSPAGNNGNIQFNNAGAFGGSDSLNCSAICSLFGSVNDTTYIQNGVSVQVRDKYAYVLTYNRYFSVYDVSVANPVRIASLYTSEGPTFADIRGNYAYVCAYSAGTQAGIQVFNISNPTAPVFVARATRVDNLYRCIARGDAVYATRHGGTGAWGLYVYDVTNPSVPVLSGSVLDNTHFDSVDGLDYQNKYIFSVGRNGRITATDVSNPASPTVASSLSDATNLGGARSIKVRGNYAYVAATTANRITVINIKDPANMALAGTLQLSTNLAECRDIELIGDYAILPSMTNSRLTIINISNPASPSEFYSLADATNLNGVVALTVNGSKVYAIANTGKRLSVFNIPGINIPSLNAGAILADNVSVNNSFIGRYGTFHNFSADALSSENLTVKNFNVRQTLAASAGAATSTYLTLTINGTIYKIALLANS
jgi:hypothetical protein